MAQNYRIGTGLRCSLMRRTCAPYGALAFSLFFALTGMRIFYTLNHLFNFVLPAFWLASLLLIVYRVARRDVAVGAVRWLRHWLWLFGSGVAVLLAGLAAFGRDGKMMTYVALVVVVGIVQAWLAKRATRQPAA